LALFVIGGLVPLIGVGSRPDRGQTPGRSPADTSDPSGSAAKPPTVAVAGVILPTLAGSGVATAATSLLSIGWFFTPAGAFVFGSGLAVIPFLYGGVVQERHWLTDRQFLDAVAVAMITPGPVVITAGLIGYPVRAAAGLTGAALGL